MPSQLTYFRLSIFGKSKFPPVELMVLMSLLDAFIQARSWLLFEKLHATGNWLSVKVDEWGSNSKHKLPNDQILKDLKVVNDLAERSKKDTQEHADLAKDSAYREDIPLVVLNHCRAFQDLQKQTLL